MKKDILGRDVPDGSLVAVRGTNKGNSTSLKVGILKGGKVQCLEDSQTVKEMFLITNLDAEETEIRDKILDRLAKEKAESVKNASERNRRVANLVGAIYKTTSQKYDYTCYLYCGERRMTVYEENEIVYQATGHVYLTCLATDDETTKLSIHDFTKSGSSTLSWYRGYERFKILKNFKKYNKEFKQIDIPSRIEINGVYNPNGYKDYEIPHPVKYKVVVEDTNIAR